MAIGTQSFAAIAVNTLRWTRHAKKEHEWTTGEGEMIDVLPISAEALASRKLIWPSGSVMNVTGLRHALAAPDHLDVDGVKVRLPAVPVIALLKIVAYRDRPDRLKDLQDLAFLLNEYPAADDDAFFTDEIFAEGLVEHEARAWLLGRSLADLVNDDEAAEVRGFFAAMLAEQVDTGRFIANSPWWHRGHEALERLRRADAGFRRSMAERRPA